MGSYNNENNTLNRFASNTRVLNQSMEQYVTEAELLEALANKIDLSTLKEVVASSSDFADFQSRISAL